MTPRWIQPPPFVVQATLRSLKPHSSSRFSGWWTPNSVDAKATNSDDDTPRKFNIAPGRLLSYWEGNFSGAMLNFGGVLDKLMVLNM